MKRRSFLYHSCTAAAGSSFMLKGMPINTAPQKSFLEALAMNGNPDNRVLVLIELNGGNDGLNTFIPLDQYANLSKARKNILIPERNVLRLSGVQNSGFHPSMVPMQKMYNDGLISVVQNVGYPEQDYSHFRSSDIWMSASSADETIENGWAGRFLEQRYPGFPIGYPSDANPDPLAIQLGSVMSMALVGSQWPMGMAITDPKAYYEFVNGVVEPAPASHFGEELEYIRLVTQQAQQYFKSVKGAADKGKNQSMLYPPEDKNYLADQLKIVAQLIKGGLKTPIYICSLYDFDTHSEQIDVSGNPLEGIHSRLLGKLSEAIGAFQDDLKLMGIADRVAGMTFSEFGRTIGSNGSFGTDHGAAAPVFVFGKSVNPGIIGKNPVIPEKLTQSGDLPMQHDFRAIYTTILKDWFGLDQPDKVLGRKFDTLPIFKSIATPTRDLQIVENFELSNYPNPFRESTTLTLRTSGGQVVVRLLDGLGRVVQMVASGYYPEGTHQFFIPRNNLSMGQYHCQVSVNGTVAVRKMVAM
ncbi:DUF1501 domain-containing protein [Haliscomenobacter sp.]|uniref:DUF1501 domain-containing protein n=1 Tax=Haliscomenobacter sp. TaxID=2717303 RepID=UPI00336526A6